MKLYCIEVQIRVYSVLITRCDSLQHTSCIRNVDPLFCIESLAMDSLGTLTHPAPSLH